MDTSKLADGDYVLTEGKAWFTVGNVSVRIYSAEYGVICDMYRLGEEDHPAIASACALVRQEAQAETP